MKTTVIGLGYVGLPLAIKLSQLGYDVLGVDVNISKINRLKAGQLPFAQDEPHLEKYFRSQYKKIVFTSSFKMISDRSLIFISVDTPILDKIPDYHSLIAALKSVSKFLKKGSIIIIESTVAPRTTNKRVIPIIERYSKLKLNEDFFVATVPERIRPNHIFEQLTTIPRVIGISHKKINTVLKKIYSQITSADIDFTDLTTAETVKTVENTYRDVNIAFANEIALACEELGVNVWEVRELVNKSPFHDMHKPGAGVGGHCIPKDPWLLASSVKKAKLILVKSAREINDSMPNHVLSLILTALKIKKVNAQKAKIAILGYSFVENSDDTRNSPTRKLAQLLQKKNMKFKIHDPFVSDFQKVEVEEVIKSSDCLVSMVAHTTYRKLDLPKLAQIMKTKIIIDGRNLIDRDKAQAAGFLYKGIGNV